LLEQRSAGAGADISARSKRRTLAQAPHSGRRRHEAKRSCHTGSWATTPLRGNRETCFYDIIILLYYYMIILYEKSYKNNTKKSKKHNENE